MSDAVAAPAAAAPAATTAPSPEATQAAAEAVTTQQPSEADRRLSELQRQRDMKAREVIVERRKFEAQLRQQQQRISQLEKLEQREQMARLNPPEFLKSIYGENWYDKVVESKLNGVPPADLLAAEMAKMREEFSGELSRRDAESQRQARVAAQQTQERQLRAGMADVQGGFTEFFSAKATDYPALAERYGGDTQAVSRALFAHAKAAWDKTVQYDETGRMVAPGQVLSPRDAAEALEKAERELVAKIQGRLTPAPTGGSIGGPRLSTQQQQQQTQQQQRRTLSNALTASTPGSRPAPSLADRRARAIQAFNAARKP